MTNDADDELDMAAPIGPMLADEAAAWLREVEAARGDCDPSAAVRAGYRVEAALRGVVAEHAARVAAEVEADGLRRDLAAVARERDAARAEVALWRGDETVALLGAVAAGKLPRCVTCGDRLATMETADGSAVPTCDPCFADDVAEWGADRAQWRDLPHAAALRAAMAKGGAT